MDILRRSAYVNGGVDRVVLWTEEAEDLPQSKSFGDFKLKHLNLFHDNVKGKGYYSIKACVIWRTLKMMDENDTLIYCDSTSIVRKSLRHLIIDLPAQLFQLWPNRAHKNSDWTKPGLFDLMSSNAQNANQLNAAVQVYRKCNESTSFVKLYLHWSSNNDAMQDDGCDSHRHDQSILTNLAWESTLSLSVSEDIVTQHGALGMDAPILHHRQLLGVNSVLKIDIVTPTVLRDLSQLAQCVRSVQEQRNVPSDVIVWHWIVVDGPLDASFLNKLVHESKTIPIKVMRLPVNTGANNWNGHRIFAALSFLVDGSYISFLDDDNWWEPDHLQHVIPNVCTGHDMVFALRKICSRDGRSVCNDLCESLGNHHNSVLDSTDHFCDTSTMTVRRSVAADVANLWNVRAREAGKMEADRAVSRALLTNRALSCVGTRKATVNYRLGGAPHSVKADFFHKGNDAMRDLIPGGWIPGRRDLYVFHFGPEQTERALRHTDITLSGCLAEWQPALLHSATDLNLINGYTHMHVIPRGATVYASLCFPQQLPLKEVFARRDLHRIVYTVESPNIMHADQWNRAFLQEHFDVWLTYWAPLLKEPQALLCYHNTHHLVPACDGSLHHLLLENEAAVPNSMCMVLANREGTKSYTIGENVLTQLDGMRKTLIQDLNITVFGCNWKADSERPNIVVGGSTGKGDGRSAVSIMQKFSFVVIVENCNAENYVSEKIYDAFIAGCIPLYYGNMGKVPIPSDMYIDLTKFHSSQHLMEMLNMIDVQQFRDRIYQKRESVLQAVSTSEFARCLCLAMDKPHPQ